ncbi:MAG: signal peptide protein [Schlesneria sp.]|nr:signal peptide protein [Schlesneria sp.]
MLRNLLKSKKGQGLVEYALLIAGVALISAAAVSTFGHKTSDLIAAVATVLPGAHQDDNNPIVSGHLIETKAGTGGIETDLATIVANKNTDRLGVNVIGTTDGAANGFGGLVVESSAN